MDIQQCFATLRRPGKDDFKRVLALMSACGMDEYGESDSDELDLQYDWDQMDLSRDVWLGENEQDELIGYAAAVPGSNGVRYDIFTHPDITDIDPNLRLLDLLIERSLEELTADSPEISATMYIAAVNQRDRMAAEMEGFTHIRSHYQMRMDMAFPPDAVYAPGGYELRTFQPDIPGEAQQIHELVQKAFVYPGRQPQSFDDWAEGMMRDDIFDPTLWFVLLRNGQMVGVNLSFIYPGLGWVRQLAVDPDWQGKGLGSILLKKSFQEFYERGYPQVGLGVRADNNHALEFYLRSGMNIKRQYCEYQLTVMEREAPAQ